MLLLYALLHGCARFHEYCLVRDTAFVCTVFQNIQYVLQSCARFYEFRLVGAFDTRLDTECCADVTGFSVLCSARAQLLLEALLIRLCIPPLLMPYCTLP